MFGACSFYIVLILLVAECNLFLLNSIFIYLNADLNHRLKTFSMRFGTYPVLTLIGKEIIVFAFSLINEKTVVVFPPEN